MIAVKLAGGRSTALYASADRFETVALPVSQSSVAKPGAAPIVCVLSGAAAKEA